MTALQVIGVGCGAVVFAAGFVVFAFRRFSVRRTPTRLVLGLSMLLLGYHLAMWSLPPKWVGLSVPADRWWMLLGGIALALAGTKAGDLLDATESEPSESSDAD